MHHFDNDLADFKTKVVCGFGSVHRRKDEAANENILEGKVAKVTSLFKINFEPNGPPYL